MTAILTAMHREMLAACGPIAETIDIDYVKFTNVLVCFEFGEAIAVGFTNHQHPF